MTDGALPDVPMSKTSGHELMTDTGRVRREQVVRHEVYWGSHGCGLPPGHTDPCACGPEGACCQCEDHARDHDEQGCVARYPWYGPETNFYGPGTPVVPEGWVIHRHDDD